MDKRARASRNLLDGLINGDLLDPMTSPRNAILVAKFASGSSIEDLSVEEGESQQTIRDALRESLPCEIYEVTDALADIQEYEERLAVNRNRKSLREWSVQNKGRPMSEAADLFGLKESQVRALLGTRRKYHPGVKVSALDEDLRSSTGQSGLRALRKASDASIYIKSGNVTKKFLAPNDLPTKEWLDLRAAIPTAPESIIRECHREIEGALTQEAFDLWASDYDLPKSQDLMLRTFSTWPQLLRASGVREASAEVTSTVQSGYPEGRDRANWADTLRPESVTSAEICKKAKIDEIAFQNVSNTLHRLRQGLFVQPETGIRDRRIIARYALGHTMQQIGDDFGVTRERVRQVIVQKAEVSTKDIQEALRLEKKYYQTRQGLAEQRAVRKWSEQNIGEPVSSAIEAFGLSESRVRKALGPRKKFHLRLRHQSGKVFSDQELIELLQAFHEETGSTVSQDFEDWSRPRGGPSRQTIMIRFEKWARALERAGISGGEEIPRSRIFTERDCWACVIEFLQVPEVDYTYAAFEKWVGQDENKPSVATVRNRLLVPWSEMVHTGLAILSGKATEELGNRWIADVKRTRDWKRLRTQREPGRVDSMALLSAAFQVQGFPLTIAKYNEWATSHGHPKAAKVMRSSGKTWNQLLESADIPLSARQKKSGSP